MHKSMSLKYEAPLLISVKVNVHSPPTRSSPPRRPTVADGSWLFCNTRGDVGARQQVASPVAHPRSLLLINLEPLIVLQTRDIR